MNAEPIPARLVIFDLPATLFGFLTGMSGPLTRARQRDEQLADFEDRARELISVAQSVGVDLGPEWIAEHLTEIRFKRERLRHEQPLAFMTEGDIEVLCA